MGQVIELKPTERYLLEKYVNDKIREDQELKRIVVVDKRRLLHNLSFDFNGHELEIIYVRQSLIDWYKDQHSIVDDIIIVENDTSFQNFRKHMTQLDIIRKLKTNHNLVILLH